jgi:hypothetical protein
VSTPLNIVTLRLQAENENEDEEKAASDEPSTGVGGVVKKIYKEDGILGFWRGNNSTSS